MRASLARFGIRVGRSWQNAGMCRRLSAGPVRVACSAALLLAAACITPDRSRATASATVDAPLRTPPDSQAVTATEDLTPSVDRSALFADAEALSSDQMEGRRTGTTGAERARALLIRRFAEIGIAPVAAGGYERPFTYGTGERERIGVNVVGVIAGTDAPDTFIVITAHYDHLGIENGGVMNGADDNASGTAGLLALAAYFVAQPPRHSLLLAALDAEEVGLRGAYGLLADPPVATAQMAINVNLDMIGRDPDDRLFAVGTRQQPFLVPFVDAVAADAPVTLLRGHDDPEGPRRENWVRDSDHYAFCQAAIPCLYLGVEDYDQHHEPTDDYATLTLDFYARAVETAIRLVRAFDQNLGAIVAR